MRHEQNPADVHSTLLKSFNAGDVDATVACYESQACFMSRSGRIARGAMELRDVYRVTFSNKPQIKFRVRKIVPAGDDLALVVVEWRSKAVSPVGEVRLWAGTATNIVRRQPDGSWKLVLDNPYGIE
jgi:ketosteroid isomerase-like protein